MFAHSIKNPHIIHFKVEASYGWLHDRSYKYLCCSSYTYSKATTDKSKVTCKNCLRDLAKREARP